MKEKRRMRITTVLSTNDKPMKVYAAEILVITKTWYGAKREYWETVYEQCQTEQAITDFFKRRDFKTVTEYVDL